MLVQRLLASSGHATRSSVILVQALTTRPSINGSSLVLPKAQCERLRKRLEQCLLSGLPIVRRLPQRRVTSQIEIAVRAVQDSEPTADGVLMDAYRRYEIARLVAERGAGPTSDLAFRCSCATHHSVRTKVTYCDELWLVHLACTIASQAKASKEDATPLLNANDVDHLSHLQSQLESVQLRATAVAKGSDVDADALLALDSMTMNQEHRSDAMHHQLLESALWWNLCHPIADHPRASFIPVCYQVGGSVIPGFLDADLWATEQMSNEFKAARHALTHGAWASYVHGSAVYPEEWNRCVSPSMLLVDKDMSHILIPAATDTNPRYHGAQFAMSRLHGGLLPPVCMWQPSFTDEPLNYAACRFLAEEGTGYGAVAAVCRGAIAAFDHSVHIAGADKSLRLPPTVCSTLHVDISFAILVQAKQRPDLGASIAATVSRTQTLLPFAVAEREALECIRVLQAMALLVCQEQSDCVLCGRGGVTASKSTIAAAHLFFAVCVEGKHLGPVLLQMLSTLRGPNAPRDAKWTNAAEDAPAPDLGPIFVDSAAVHSRWKVLHQLQLLFGVSVGGWRWFDVLLLAAPTFKLEQHVCDWLLAEREAICACPRPSASALEDLLMLAHSEATLPSLPGKHL